LGGVIVLMVLALGALRGGGGRAPEVAQAAQDPTGEPTAVPASASTVPAWAIELPLTTPTISLYQGNKCAVWGEQVGSSPMVTVTAGPVLVSYSVFSRYMETPRFEDKYLFAMRVGESLADLTLNGQPLTTTYRGELRIEYVPAPVSKRYSYATYALMTLKPGAYELAGAWRLAGGEKDGPRRCRLAVAP
jgi:hypothetical protein